MKILKRFAAPVFLLIVCAFISRNDFVFSEETHRTSLPEENRAAWRPIIANNVNSQKIKLHIDNKKINDAYVYMNDRGDIMFPAKLVVDEFDCSMRMYENNSKLVIQRSDTVVTWYLDENYVTINNSTESNKSIEEEAHTEKNGEEIYFPLRILAESLECQYVWDSNTNTLNIFDLFSKDSCPAAFCYKNTDKLPTVKNQGSFGTCWAFAALSALESTLLPTESYEFSVDHMTIRNSFYRSQNDGGDYTMALAYLAAWQGPVLEKDDPYGDGKSPDDLQAVRHIQEARIIDAKDLKKIKEMVFKYGAVQTSLYINLENLSDTSKYYNKNTSAYCYIGNEKPNHDVIVVGWDDNYSRKNFNTEIEADGAFICMNSWGSGFGRDGIFYVSYYDTNIGVHNIVYTGIEKADNYDNIYQSDLCGYVGRLGYMKDNAYFSNVYTAECDETLKAVSFYATGKNTEYEIYFVPDFKGTESFSGMRILTSGRFDDAGYYTVPVDKGILLLKGERFAVVVKIRTPGSDRPIAVEYAAGNSTKNVDLSDGEGYISLQGKIWENTEKMQNCNVCLKVFTDRYR